MIRGLGELALRVMDLDASTTFYRDVVGLEVFDDQSPDVVFLKMGEGVEGHPQTLALFARGVDVGQKASTLDHFAFLIDLGEHAKQKERLEGIGVKTFTREFPHFHWRSIFFADPDGNTVEFVCYDPSVT